MSKLPVRLRQLRNLARRDPERPAREVLDADLLAIVAALADQAPALIRHRSLLESRSTNGRLFGPKGAMVLLVGKPCGKAGFVSKRCLRAFTWLLIFVCIMCIKDGLSRRGCIKMYRGIHSFPLLHASGRREL